MIDKLFWPVTGFVSAVLLGIYIGSTAKDYQYEHNQYQHHSRCPMTEKYVQFPATDSFGNKLCFRQSKLTGRIERTHLVYTE